MLETLLVLIVQVQAEPPDVREEVWKEKKEEYHQANHATSSIHKINCNKRCAASATLLVIVLLFSDECTG
jgi:hypothetical protein